MIEFFIFFAMLLQDNYQNERQQTVKQKVMYNIRKPYMKPDSRLAEIVRSNPSMLYVLEYFQADYMIREMTVSEFCGEHRIDVNLFVAISNIYNGFPTESKLNLDAACIPVVIQFLRNTHFYYRNEKYPEIQSLIDELRKVNNAAEIGILEKFFAEYYAEVDEHLTYEDRVAFPYFEALYRKFTGAADAGTIAKFSASEYRDHHTDIEYKLDELKNLLIRYIPVGHDRTVRRKLLTALNDVESNLNAHSAIESHILMPLVIDVEKKLAR